MDSPAIFYAVAADTQTETAIGTVATGAQGIALLHKREDLKLEEARRARNLMGASSARGSRTQMQGVVVDAETLAPITDGPLVYCMQPTDQLCTLWVSQIYANDQGLYGFGMLRSGPGRYQALAIDAGSGRYGVGYSKIFDFDGSKLPQALALKMAPLPAHISQVQGCSGDLPAGAVCDLIYTVTNESDTDVKVDLWASITTGLTGAPYDDGVFDMGANANAQPITLTLAAGTSTQVTQHLPLPQMLPSGAAGSIVLYAAKSGKPALGYGTATVGGFRIVP